MRKIQRGISIGAATLLGAALCSPIPATTAFAAAGNVTINIVGITDFHGHIEENWDPANNTYEGGAVGLACAVKQARSADPNTLFVSAGDNVGGSAFISSILQDNPTMDVLNAIGLDVTAAGNHEFDKGVTDITDRIAPKLNAPILAANITGNEKLSAEGAGNGTWVKEVNGVKVGFVGVVTDELNTLVGPNELGGVSIQNPTDTANQRAAALKTSGQADIVIALAHEDAEVNARAFSSAVDAIYGGHTHVPYSGVTTSKDGTPIAVVQADHYGSLLGNIQLQLSKTDGKYRVTTSTATTTPLHIDGCTDAYDVAAIVQDAKAASDEAGAKELGTVSTDFLTGRKSSDAQDVSRGNNRGTESTASNMLADSFKWWVESKFPGLAEHYIGVMNPGGVRASLHAGTVTFKDAYNVQPFGNDVGYGVYTVAQLKKALEQQFKGAAASHPMLLLGVSGNVTVFMDETKQKALLTGETDDPTGVVAAIYIDGKAVADSDKLVIASNSFLLSGGDGFSAFLAAPITKTGYIDNDATSDYISSHPGLAADYSKRQLSSNISVDEATRSVTADIYGLLFTFAAEQRAPGAANKVEAYTTTADGKEITLASTSIDGTVPEKGFPETGHAALHATLPAGAATTPCEITGQTQHCGKVYFRVLHNDGSSRILQLNATIPLGAGGTGSGTVLTPPPSSGTTVVSPKQSGKAEQLATTGTAAAASTLGTVSGILLAIAGVAVLITRRLRQELKS